MSRAAYERYEGSSAAAESPAAAAGNIAAGNAAAVVVEPVPFDGVEVADDDDVADEGAMEAAAEGPATAPVPQLTLITIDVPANCVLSFRTMARAASSWLPNLQQSSAPTVTVRVTVTVTVRVTVKATIT